MARILVVDDEYSVRLPLRRVLESEGHEVTEAIHGDEALQLFGESPFDLVLLDIFMPERDGISTLGELLVKSPQAKVVVMSGKANFLPEARDLGATETIWKPIDTDILLDIIERALEKSQS